MARCSFYFVPISLFYLMQMAFVPNIKYKTEYCLYWQEGRLCEKGNYCFFAHGDIELRTIKEVPYFTNYATAINHTEITLRNSQAGQFQGKSNNYKTVFCKFYAEGQCKLGEKCSYAHQRREKRKKKGSQDYKIEVDNSSFNFDISQSQDSYNQYYYYQLYQNYANYQSQFPQQQSQRLHGQQQIKMEEGQFLNYKVEDVKIEAQSNNGITQKKRNEDFQNSQILQSLQNSGEISPNSTKTASPVMSGLKMFGNQADFKAEI